ncbi:MAG: S8 family serine peptidase [Anaerolineae bacterium]|nr:S8 family serine peptidase [Anaerolineae bacterium]
MRSSSVSHGRFWSVILLVGMLIVAAMPTASAMPVAAIAAVLDPERVQPASELPYVPGEIVIGWQPDAQLQAQARAGQLDVDRTGADWQQAVESFSARTGLQVLDVQPEYGVGRVVVAPGQEQAEIARLSALPWVRYVEPNYLARAAGYPNDPYIGNQWHMRRVGAPAAWDLTFGSYSLLVAVIDSGIALTHPEFAGRLAPGWDYVNNDADPTDDYGHGTHVTGIIAAAADNGVGVAGLAANVKVLPLKALDWKGEGTYTNIALAIRRAADNNAEVINLSLGGIYPSADLSDAINYATSRNAVVVAAAGNCAQGGAGCGGMTNPDYYPAAYPSVIAVGATDHYDNWASYSGYKPYVDLAAPGGVDWDQIMSTIPGGYGLRYGTSMATPLVSAAAALVRTYLPAATSTEVTDILKNTADKVGPYSYSGGRNDWFGAGRLNVARAVRWAYPPSLKPIAQPAGFLLGGAISQASMTLPLTSDSDRPQTWQATVLQGAWLQALPTSGAVSYSAPGALTLKVDSISLTPGSYEGIVEVRPVSPASASQVFFVSLRVAATISPQFLPLITNRRQAMDWLDPATGGTPISPTDDTPSQVDLPFPVSFYGNMYDTVSVSYKGFVSFTQPGSGPPVAQSSCLPTAALPNDAIYVLWQNWLTSLGGQVYIQYPDADRFAVTWAGVRRFAGDLPHDFQLVFFRDGRIMLQYRAVQSPVVGTIGIEGWDGTFAQQIACNGAGRLPTSGDAVPVDAKLPW